LKRFTDIQEEYSLKYRQFTENYQQKYLDAKADMCKDMYEEIKKL